MSRPADQEIAFHYDVSDEFYALFLDRRMVYTCAYYPTPDATLEQAQEEKLERVCRKLWLRPGERFLDLGCGWGGLVMWAAERRGAQAHGVTLSAAQAAWAQRTIVAGGLDAIARVDRGDWRALDTGARYDKIAAVGLIEHVGLRHHVAFFATVHGLLAAGGLFLNHGITIRDGAPPSSQMEFLTRHVFPGGELASLGCTIQAAERAGLEVLDVENLRSHYVHTTREWATRLQANAARARALVGERRYRTWLVYLAAASIAFEEGWIALHQVVARRRQDAGLDYRRP